MNRFSNLLIKSIGALTLTGLAACDYIHDDSIAPCEYRLRLVYDYNMKFADAFQCEVDKAALFICDNKGNFIRRQDIEGAELKANNIASSPPNPPPSRRFASRRYGRPTLPNPMN